MSGGFRQMIAPTATLLNVPLENVFANLILFNDDGSYAGYGHIRVHSLDNVSYRPSNRETRRVLGAYLR